MTQEVRIEEGQLVLVSTRQELKPVEVEVKTTAKTLQFHTQHMGATVSVSNYDDSYMALRPDIKVDVSGYMEASDLRETASFFNKLADQMDKAYAEKQK